MYWNDIWKHFLHTSCFTLTIKEEVRLFFHHCIPLGETSKDGAPGSVCSDQGKEEAPGGKGADDSGALESWQPPPAPSPAPSPVPSPATPGVRRPIVVSH